MLLEWYIPLSKSFLLRKNTALQNKCADAPYQSLQILQKDNNAKESMNLNNSLVMPKALAQDFKPS